MTSWLVPRMQVGRWVAHFRRGSDSPLGRVFGLAVDDRQIPC